MRSLFTNSWRVRLTVLQTFIFEASSYESSLDYHDIVFHLCRNNPTTADEGLSTKGNLLVNLFRQLSNSFRLATRTESLSIAVINVWQGTGSHSTNYVIVKIITTIQVGGRFLYVEERFIFPSGVPSTAMDESFKPTVRRAIQSVHDIRKT